MTLTAGVLICTRNRVAPLVACLASVARQTRQAAQIIIVDSSDIPLNSRADFAHAFSQERFPDAEMIYLHTSPGLTYQRNQGVARVTTDVVFFFDDDVVLAPDYVATLMETLEGYPEYGGGMGRIADIQALPRRPGDYLRRLFLLSHSFAKGRMLPSGFPAHAHGSNRFLEVEVLSGAAMAYRAQVLEAHAFDEWATGYAYMEDVDFSYRVSSRYKLFYDPRAVIEHRHAPVAHEDLQSRRCMLMVNHSYFFFKNIYPDCKWRILAYLWAVGGLFVVAALGGQWTALLGYVQGIHKIISRRMWKGRRLE